MEKPYVVGIDIGGTNTVFGVVDARGTILYSGSIKTGKYADVNDYVAELAKGLKSVIDQAGGPDKIKGVGVGAPNGNFFNGCIEFAPNLPWKGKIPLAQLISEQIDGIPVALTNDANAAAIGEMTYGAARGMKDFIVITLGTGVGSGIVIGGNLVYGHDGFAGELGHVIMRRNNGRQCGCGRQGCLEAYASATGVARTAREYLEIRKDESVLRDLDPDEITSKDVYDAAMKNDKIALEIFEATGSMLGEAFADFVAFSSPEAIILFGGMYLKHETVARLMAPIAPFYADRLYTDLIAATGRDTVVSVHLAKFPECNEALIDGELEARMQMAQDVTSMVLALRRKVNIKVRQPLQCIMVPVVDEEQKMHIEAVKDLIMSEVNVKEIKFVDGAAGVLVKKVKCDFKKLGPKFGKQMKAVAAAVAGMSQEAIAELEKNGKYTFVLDGAEAVIETTDVEIFSEDIPGWLVANEGKLTVALEVTVTEELRREGVARELVNRIQNIRKSSGFEITDKIKVALSKNPQTDDAVNEYNTYICNQVLANSLELVDEVKNGTELNFDDFSLYVSVVKE